MFSQGRFLDNSKGDELTVSSSADPASSQFLSSKEGTAAAEDWVTGDDDMTFKQDKYLQDLCKRTGETYDPKWSKAEASKKIQFLRRKLRNMSNSK